MKDRLKIIIISDGTGETASLITRAAVLQFADKEIEFTRYKNIRTKTQIQAIFQDAVKRCNLVAYTIVSPELSLLIEEEAAEADLLTVNLLGPVINAMSIFFETKPMEEPGLFHQVDDNYYRRIGAMEYTIKHDDGKDYSRLDKADIILLGISRTSKTPLSMFLSHQGWRVCNVPIIKDIPIPKEIYAVPSEKIVALTIQADILQSIRKSRLERLGKKLSSQQNQNYTSLESISDEIEYANLIFRKNRGWPVLDVSGKALEEIAMEIHKIMSVRKKLSQAGKKRWSP